MRPLLYQHPPLAVLGTQTVKLAKRAIRLSVVPHVLQP